MAKESWGYAVRNIPKIDEVYIKEIAKNMERSINWVLVDMIKKGVKEYRIEKGEKEQELKLDK